jgi:transposase InsO family protein
LTGGACCAVSFLVASPVRVRRVPLPGRVIVVAVRWYLRYGLPYRDVEELLNERGIEVDQVTVYRRVQRFTPLPADAARFARHTPGDRWFVDETYVKVNGVWRYVYRAVDQQGRVIELLSRHRDAAAARRFFARRGGRRAGPGCGAPQPLHRRLHQSYPRARRPPAGILRRRLRLLGHQDSQSRRHFSPARNVGTGAMPTMVHSGDARAAIPPSSWRQTDP